MNDEVLQRTIKKVRLIHATTLHHNGLTQVFVEQIPFPIDLRKVAS